MNIEPLTDIPISPSIATLPKADLHIHQEERPRLDRVVSQREGRPAYDWRAWSRHLIQNVPPGMPRLAEMGRPDATLDFHGVAENSPEMLIARVVDLLEEAAADGAIFVEIRFGPAGLSPSRPDFTTLLREAERQVQGRYPKLYAEASGFLYVVDDPARLQAGENQLEVCLRLAGDGLTGMDFVVSPYEDEADPATWEIAYRWAARAAEDGLGITVHAGEFSDANLDAALRTPGLSRIGHGVHAVKPRFLEQMIQKNITVECCLSCNVVLGAVSSYEVHPIRQFIDAGIPVTLNTDDPVRIWTTIGREYAIAAEMGFSQSELLGFTRNAIEAGFTTSERKRLLLKEIVGREA
jgi:adenosine deaminase